METKAGRLYNEHTEVDCFQNKHVFLVALEKVAESLRQRSLPSVAVRAEDRDVNVSVGARLLDVTIKVILI